MSSPPHSPRKAVPTHAGEWSFPLLTALDRLCCPGNRSCACPGFMMAFGVWRLGRVGAAQPQAGFRHGGQPLPPWWGLLLLVGSASSYRRVSVSTLASSIYGQDFPCPKHPTTYNTPQSKQPHPRQPPPMATSMTHGNLLMTSFINAIIYLGHSLSRAAPRRTYSTIPQRLQLYALSSLCSTGEASS